MPIQSYARRPAPVRPSYSSGSCSVVTPAPPPSDLAVRRLPVRFESDVRRVIVRPFVMENSRVRSLFDRMEGLAEEEVADLLGQVRGGYGNRHRNLDAAFDEHFALG